MCVNNIIVSCEDCCSWQTHKCSGLILYYLVDLQILNITIWLFSIYVMSYDLVLCKNHCFFADVIVIWMVITMLGICPLLKCLSWQTRAIIFCLTHYAWNLSHCWSSDRFVLRLLPCLTILTYICLYVWHVWRRRMYECLICVMLPMFIASNMCKIYFLFTAIFVLFCPAMICVHSYVFIPVFHVFIIM